MDETIERIRRFLERPYATKALIAAAAKTHVITVARVLKADCNPGLKTLKKLGDAVTRLESAIDG